MEQGLNRTGTGAQWRHASMHINYNFQGLRGCFCSRRVQSLNKTLSCFCCTTFFPVNTTYLWAFVLQYCLMPRTEPDITRPNRRFSRFESRVDVQHLHREEGGARHVLRGDGHALRLLRHPAGPAGVRVQPICSRSPFDSICQVSKLRTFFTGVSTGFKRSILTG